MKSIKFVFLKAIIIVFFTFCAGSSYSQNQPESYLKTEGTNKVQFMGVENNFLVFDLLFTDVPAKGCTLKIMDHTGNTVYEEIISGNSFTKRYKMPKDEFSKISFKAMGKGFVFNQAFIIKKEETLVVTSE
ncbi:MAG: hypothetical protein E6H08_02375 [Bacteroidetes bacterium]|nr:MAG: hypothetical protein E6H08_02375 [Bacteroidota bacterium]